MPYHDKSSLSQNFIKHWSLVKELLEASDVNSDDVVVEIGAGKGIITKELSGTAKEVIAIEKDEALANELRGKLKMLTNVKIINEDFLDYKLPKTPYKVFANIPFSITSEIITKILKSDNLPESMHLIMQKEAAIKLLGSPTETQSSILTKPFYEIEILGEIDRSNFTQKPQVIIVFVRFMKRDKPFIQREDKSDFRKFVIFGFNQWKGTWIEAYKKIFTFEQMDRLKKMYKLKNLKPSQVSFDNWLQIYKTYKKIRTNG